MQGSPLQAKFTREKTPARVGLLMKVFPRPHLKKGAMTEKASSLWPKIRVNIDTAREPFSSAVAFHFRVCFEKFNDLTVGKLLVFSRTEPAVPLKLEVAPPDFDRHGT